MVEQEKLDNLMLELDGTENKCKQRLGWEEKESTETGRGCAGGTVGVRGPPPPLPKATAEGGNDVRQRDRKLGVGMRSSGGCLGRGEAFPFLSPPPPTPLFVVENE